MHTCPLLVALLLPLAASARPLKLAVLELGNRADLPTAEVRYLTEVVRSAALHLPPQRFLILTRENILAHLPPGVELEACEGECEVETARNVGADRVISGEVIRLGVELRVALRLHEVDAGRLLAATRAASSDVAGLETPLAQAADALVAGLMEAPSAPALAAEPVARPAPIPVALPPPRRARSLPPGLAWVGFAGGRFTQGDRTRGGSATPEHAVVVGGFALTRSEVTVAQYSACVRDGACTPALATSPRCTAGGPGQLPINCVSAEQAERMCAWLGGRLPSEAEWEHAARQGERNVPRPLEFLQSEVNCEVAVMRDGRGAGCGRNRPAPPCSRPGRGAVCDLLGNVSEWVADCWHADYHGAPGDARPWVTDCHGGGRVIRGGSFADDRTTVHPAERRLRMGGQPRVDIGFRCAR